MQCSLRLLVPLVLVLLASSLQVQAGGRPSRFLLEQKQKQENQGTPAAEAVAANATSVLNATAPATEGAPNVTAMDGPHPLGLGGLAGAAANALAAAAAPWLPAGTFGGDGTAYSEAVPNTGKGFACSYRYINDWASTHFAAMNAAQWDDGNACGRCITAWCTDERCATRNKKVQVMIVDKCPECKHGDVDFSIPVYRDITGIWPNRLTIEWEWSDCSANMDGGIHLSPKDGINAQWQAWYFSNAKYPLKSITLNGTPLQRNEFQFWTHAAPLPSGPAQLVFEAENGETLTTTCDNMLTEQVLPTNFQ